MRTGFVTNLDEVAYHADPDSLSHSGAKALLRAPALYRWEQDHPVVRDVFDFGSAAHKLVLGVGPLLCVVEADDWRTKDAKEQRDQARERGEVPLLTKDHKRVLDMADALATHPTAMGLFSRGEAEVSAFAVDEETGVRRRCRFDWLADNYAVDYKTSVSAEPEAFGRAAATYGYDMQDAWYRDVADSLGRILDAFGFIVQMKDPPYLVSVVELDSGAVERGRARNRRALEIYRDCTEANLWPGFQPAGEITTVSLPRWAYYEEGYAS